MSKNKLFAARLPRLPLLATGLLAFAAPATHAQESPRATSAESEDSLPEIVVTAQRRAQNIQDVGMAVTAFSTAEIQELGTQELSSLVGRVPSLQYNEYGPIVTIYNIRGVSQNDFADHLEAPIAVYIDDAYLASMAISNGQMFDVAGVEVARGPQGTLFGRNATGGLIHVVTAKPTRSPDGYLSLTGGSFGQISTEGAMGGSLTDRLRGRISFATNNADGYVTNRMGPAAGNMNNAAVRLQLEADVSSNGTFLLNLRGNRNHNEQGAMYAWQAAIPGQYGLGRLVGPNEDAWGTCPGCDAQGYRNPSSDPFNQAYNSPNYFFRNVGGGTGTFTFKLPAFTFVSVTDYARMGKDYAEDSDASPNSVYDFVVNQKFEQYSQELRISHDSGTHNWTAGLYYLHVQYDDKVYSTFYPGGPFREFTPYVDKTDSWSAFGQDEFKLAPRWSAILGVRYSNDKKSEDYRLYDGGVLDPGSVFNPSVTPLAERTFGGLSAKAELDFKPNTDSLYYVSYNRGTKGGGFAAPNFGPISQSQLPYDQEILTSYEAGYKLTLFGNKLRFNGDAFYYDYHNYQAFSFFGLVPAIRNQDATIKGAEFDISARPVSGLTLQVGASFLSSEVKHVLLPDRVTFVNTAMPQAPHQSYNALLRYEHPVGQGVMALETDWKHDSGQFYTSLNNPDEYEPSRTYGNARASYQFGEGRWQVAAAVNNVSDSQHDVYRFDFSGIGVSQRVLAKPRSYALTLTYRIRNN